MSKRSCYQNPMKQHPKKDYHSLFFLVKLAKVLLMNFIATHWEHFIDALQQHTDGCTDVPWLLMQAHHSIRCSHKWCTNLHFSQHMIFRYCDEAQASLCKCADSQKPLLPAHEISHCPVTMPALICRLTRVYAAGVNSTQTAI